MTKGYLSIFILLFISVYSYGQKKNDETNQYWIETGYLDCLEKNLPCDCARWGLPPTEIDYSLNSIDSSFFGRHRIVNYLNLRNEEISFDIVSLLAELDKENDQKITAHIEIKNDSIYYYYFKDSTQYEYISTEQETGTLGVQKINSILTKNDHGKLSNHLKSDSLECYCDTQLGYNFIAIKNSTFNKEKWIVEIRENELVLFKLKALKVKRFTEYRRSHFPHKKKIYKRFKLKDNSL